MSTFTASAFFAVATLAPPSASLATAAFAVAVRPESIVLIKSNDSLEPQVVKINVGGQLMDPEN